MNKPIPLISLESDLLYRRLTTAEVGEEITYSELSALIGRDVQDAGAGNLATARNKALNQNQIVFGTIRNVGIVRLDDAGRLGATKAHINRSRRIVRKGRKVAATVDPAKLSPDERGEYRNIVTTAAVLDLVTRPMVQKKLAVATGSAGRSLAVKEVLGLFAK